MIMMDIIDTIGEISTRIEHGLAVLAEVVECYDPIIKPRSIEADTLALSSDHVRHLLLATDYILRAVLTDMIAYSDDIAGIRTAHTPVTTTDTDI